VIYVFYVAILPQAQSLLSINAIIFAKKDMILQNVAAQRELKARFDIICHMDLIDHVLVDCLTT